MDLHSLIALDRNSRERNLMHHIAYVTHGHQMQWPYDICESKNVNLGNNPIFVFIFHVTNNKKDYQENPHLYN